MENGITYCKDSITIEETKLQSSICRALNNAINNQSDALELILSNLSYAVTGDEETLEIYAMEKQIKDLDDEMDNTVKMSGSSGGDKKMFQSAIREYSDQISALRQRLSLIRSKIASNEKVNLEIERIRELLINEEGRFDTFDETTVRRLIEYIRVMPNKTLLVVLKGGMQLEEKI